MVAFGWEKGSNIRLDARLALHLSHATEADPWLHTHLHKRIEMTEKLKVVYRGNASFAKLQASRTLGQIKMKKSKSGTDFQAHFDNLLRQVAAASGHKDMTN